MVRFAELQRQQWWLPMLVGYRALPEASSLPIHCQKRSSVTLVLFIQDAGFAGAACGRRSAPSSTRSCPLSDSPGA